VEVIVVVTAVGVAGAQTSFAVFGVTSRSPNWSFSVIAGNVAFEHFTL
jgi:hypothetical protein